MKKHNQKLNSLYVVCHFPVLKFENVLIFFFVEINLQGLDLEPEFDGTIQNVTYPAGREAVLTCSVRNLGRYKVRTILSTYKILII